MSSPDSSSDDSPDGLGISGIIVNKLRRSVSTQSGIGRSLSPGQLVNDLRRSVSTRSSLSPSLSPGQFVSDLRRSVSSASVQTRYGRSLSPGQLDNQHRRSSSTGSPSRYSPLAKPSQEIRLVILEPALSENEVISCSLRITDVATTKYEALSYAWGDATKKTPILFGGEQFLVTRNLEHALRSLRDPGERRALWIDALCINQENDAERSEQVGRMGSIYKSADRVLVWLGDYYEPEDHLIKFEPSIWGFNRQNWGSWETTNAAFKLAKSLFEQSSVAVSGKMRSKKRRFKPTMNLHTWGFLSIICQRSWFRRLWVIQEITSAKKVMICCGQLQLRWKILEGAADRIAAFFETPNEWPFFGKLKFIDEMTSFAGNISIVGLWDLDKANVLSIIVHTQYSEATDARDRLFALRGLLSADDTDIEVNYSDPAREVYRKWARKRIRRTQSLDVLTLCTDCHRFLKDDKIPSWVPDLRNVSLVDDTFFALANSFSQNQEISYQAAGSTKCQEIPIEESDRKSLSKVKLNTDYVLSIQGLHIGTIAKRISISEKFGINYTTDQLPHAVTYLTETISAHFKTSVHSRKGLYDEFLDCLFKGWKWYAGSDPLPTLADRYKVWWDHSPIPADFEPFTHPNIRRRNFLGSMEMILRLMLRVSDIFITKSGSIGSMSKHCNAKVGDKVYVLLGGNAPFILRPLDMKGRRAYELRCACFLHGYMQGEAIEAWRKGDLKLENLIIV